MKKFFITILLAFSCVNFIGCANMQGLPNGSKNDVYPRMQEMHVEINESSQNLYVEEQIAIERNPNASVFEHLPIWKRKVAFVESD